VCVQGQCNENQKNRHAKPVIQAALDIQSFANLRWYGLIRDYRFSERRVGSREHCSQYRCLKNSEYIEHHQTEAESKSDNAGQTQQQHS